MTTQRRTPLDHTLDTAAGPTESGSAKRSTPAKIQETLDARDALADALTRAGIQLPAMDVRTPWQDTVEGEDDDTGAGAASRYALVHLGVCSAPVAFALAAVIVEGASG